MKLKEDHLIDYRDFNGRYLKAKIMETDYDEERDHLRFGVHYINWDHKWNVWSAPKYQYRRYAVHGSISQRGRHREEMNYINLQNPCGQYMEVKPLHLYHHSMFKLQHQPHDTKMDREYIPKYQTWHVAELCFTHKYSAQVKCLLLRENEDGKWSKPLKCDVYWVHLDNVMECAPRNTNIVDPVVVHEPEKKKKQENSAFTRKRYRPDDGNGPAKKRQRRNSRRKNE